MYSNVLWGLSGAVVGAFRVASGFGWVGLDLCVQCLWSFRNSGLIGLRHGSGATSLWVMWDVVPLGWGLQVARGVPGLL